MVKVNIFSDLISFIKLLANDEFVKGRDLKYIIKNRANIFLLLEEEELKRYWNDSESLLRSLCDSQDIPCPQANPRLKRVFENPRLIYQIDPFAIWFIDTTVKSIQQFKENLGVWIENPEYIKDDCFYLHYQKEYEQGDIVNGSSRNGWKNYLEGLARPKSLPPMNAVVINDRHLINNTNERNATRYGFAGLNNLVNLLDAFLPQSLLIPFHLLIYCQHPQLSTSETHAIIDKFRQKVTKLRSYDIIIEFVYNVSKHKRTFHSNYFLFDLDRGYNAFNVRNWIQLNGENEFRLESYQNDPQCSGDTNYSKARTKIHIIQSQCESIEQKPFYPSNYDIAARGKSFELVNRVDIEDDCIINRLFQ